MEQGIIERLADVPAGTYKKRPIETYLRMQRNMGTCMVDQWIPTNPLSMGDHGYDPGTNKSATTGQERIVMDGILIDSPEAVIAHLEQKVFPQLRQEIEAWNQDADSIAKNR